MLARGRRVLGAAVPMAVMIMVAAGCGPSAEQNATQAQAAAAQARAASARAQAAAALASEQAADAQRRADHAAQLFQAAAAEFDDAANRLEKAQRNRALTVRGKDSRGAGQADESRSGGEQEQRQDSR
jgi:thioesterase domain-containing protein